MWNYLRLPSGTEDALYDGLQQSFCGSCRAQKQFSGLVTALGINYLQAFLHLIATGLDDRGIGRAPCGTMPWQTTDVRLASRATEDFLAATNLLILRSLLRARVKCGDLPARIGEVLLNGGARKARRQLTAASFPSGVFDALGSATLAGSVWDEAMESLLERLAHICGHPEIAAPLARIGRSLGRSLLLLQWLDPGPDADWLAGVRKPYAPDEAPELRTELRESLLRVRDGLAALPLGSSAGVVRAIVDGILDGKTAAPPQARVLSALKLRVLQSGAACSPR